MIDFNRLIANCNYDNFNETALEIFCFQAKNCTVFRQYIDSVGKDYLKIKKVEDIVYLPISFFKTHTIQCLDKNAELEFKSSGTGGERSKHSVFDTKVYEKSFVSHFNHQFRDFKNYCHLALLPNYIEQGNSSLIYQVNHFVKNSNYKGSFFLENFDELKLQLQFNKEQNIPTILWGVSYALLDFADQFNMIYDGLTLIETGGMKGRRKEMIRNELHQSLQKSFPASSISSEYGMTELFSQAYWNKNKMKFETSPTFQVNIRDTNDPFSILPLNRHGAINAIDLHNWMTCSFIETADLGIKHQDGFEVLGRLDNAEIRGCSLMYI